MMLVTATVGGLVKVTYRSKPERKFSKGVDSDHPDGNLSHERGKG